MCILLYFLPHLLKTKSENTLDIFCNMTIIFLENVRWRRGEQAPQTTEEKRCGRRYEACGVAVAPSKAKEFLTSLRRPKRNIWDRSRPDVQQWIMQFMHMGYDEARLETDLSYWMDLARSSDQGRQHHYDESAPIGPQDPSSYRHGANVNYDYY
ncbi:augurin-A-like [Oncorhynchus keta]|uniref:augurin-A-like n=1 Tax=Oncorhynchus keta TaxID=8018 RepID=UPI0015FB459B|nr:augurin-A-like [Oncorhynchus keta]